MDLGKKFETSFRINWKQCFPNTFIYRLPDMLGGYAGTGGSNPCDFLCLPVKDKLFMLELKSHQGNTIPWSAIRQYDKLLSYNGLQSVYPGILIWFIDHNKIVYCPIEEAKKMHDDGKKSINIKMLDEKLYNIYEVPTVKKRVFLEADYTKLLEDLENHKMITENNNTLYFDGFFDTEISGFTVKDIENDTLPDLTAVSLEEEILHKVKELQKFAGFIDKDTIEDK